VNIITSVPKPLLQGGTSLSSVVDRFFHLYFDSRVWQNTYWLGHPIVKNPFDMVNLQEIMFEIKPDVIVECGTFRGGSALFMATLCDLIGKGRIITIDRFVHEPRPGHARITYLTADSASQQAREWVDTLIAPGEVVLVILDSDHSEAHVTGELHNFHSLVTVGSYLIVEDTCVGHPVLPELLPGPMEAVEKFMAHNDSFVIDTSRHKFHMTFNPNGYLRKVK
jgi:cephalosporin hydroxylase